MSKCYICDYNDATDNGHIIARVLGGTTSPRNIRRICKTCNSRMGTQHMDEYKKKYDEGRTPSVQEFNCRPIPKKDRIPLSSPKWWDMLVEFVSTYKIWPTMDDEYAPSTQPKRKKNHVLHGLYNNITQKERMDWIAFLAHPTIWDYAEFRNNRKNKLHNDKYEKLRSLALEYNLPFDRSGNRKPWLLTYRNQRRRITYIVPSTKDKIYNGINEFELR